jgi:hypothetical protein
MQSTGPTSPTSPLPDAAIPLAAAVRELFSGLRAGAADVADLVAAEAQVALRLLVALVLTAVGAAMLGVFTVGGILVASATALIAHGVSVAAAVIAVTLICAVACLALMFRLRVLARKVLFGHSRHQFRGER